MTLFKKLFLHSPIRYIVAFAISSVITLLYLFINGWNYKIYYIDAFTTGGFVTFLFGLLVLVTHFGAFDTFSYAFSSLRKERKYKDLVEYTEVKKAKRAGNHFVFIPYLLVGLLFIIVGLIFLI